MYLQRFSSIRFTKRDIFTCPRFSRRKGEIDCKHRRLHFERRQRHLGIHVLLRPPIRRHPSRRTRAPRLPRRRRGLHRRRRHGRARRRQQRKQPAGQRRRPTVRPPALLHALARRDIHAAATHDRASEQPYPQPAQRLGVLLRHRRAREGRDRHRTEKLGIGIQDQFCAGRTGKGWLARSRGSRRGTVAKAVVWWFPRGLARSRVQLRLPFEPGSVAQPGRPWGGRTGVRRTRRLRDRVQGQRKRGRRGAGQSWRRGRGGHLAEPGMSVQHGMLPCMRVVRGKLELGRAGQRRSR